MDRGRAFRTERNIVPLIYRTSRLSPTRLRGLATTQLKQRLLLVRKAGVSSWGAEGEERGEVREQNGGG